MSRQGQFSAPDGRQCQPSTSAQRWRRLLLIGCALVLLVGLFTRRAWERPQRRSDTPLTTTAAEPSGRGADRGGFRFGPVPTSAAASTPEAIVAQKLAQFAQSRREHVYALARRHHVDVPDEVERFFTAVESGNWDDIEGAFSRINGGDSSAGHSIHRAPELTHLWPAIIDAYGAAEQVHEWPAQKLLDYGQAVLDSLRPGMVYVGGTDNGRWIPELLNDTSQGEHHIVITQNALADATYLDYVRLQYDDRMANLTEDESQHAFQEYLADAETRLKHDQEHPDEPKQIRPGEEVRIAEGKTQVSGQVAVMSINERLLQMLMDKNPELSFAIQESFPLKATYSDAAPLGPLMELRAKDGPTAFTAERVADSLGYWQNRAQDILADPEATASPATLKSYSHDAVSAANLLVAHGFSAEAEQGYRLAAQLWPGNPESIGGLAELLAQSGREAEARALVQDFARKYPDQQKALPPVWSAILVGRTAAPDRP